MAKRSREASVSSLDESTYSNTPPRSNNTEPIEHPAKYSQIDVEDQTARLPGAPGATGGLGDFIASLRGAKEQLDDSKPPFRSRRRVWLPFR